MPRTGRLAYPGAVPVPPLRPLPVRLIHTADWHLGHALHGFGREQEHARFLDWLLDRLEEHRADALVVAGDVFDGQNPPVSALTQFYRFLAQARLRLPHLQTVVVAGNHDSGTRLEAPSPLLAELGVRVVGGVARGADGTLDAARLVVPLRDRTGEVAARCVAMPYLRMGDLPPLEHEDPLVEGVRRLYADATAIGRAHLRPAEALLLTGHCYMRGGSLSELSERKILGGNLHALPVDIFAEEAAYVALGHLHRPQAVGGREQVRYSGSPIPLALDEEPYPHQVMLAEFAAGRLVEREALWVPRAVGIRRINADSPDEALAALARLELDAGLPRDAWPYLEVTVALPAPRPGLREEVEQVLAGRPVRLCKLSVRLTGAGGALAEADAGADLTDLSPEDVFLKLHARDHEEPPRPDLLAAFRALVERVEEQA